MTAATCYVSSSYVNERLTGCRGGGTRQPPSSILRLKDGGSAGSSCSVCELLEASEAMLMLTGREGCLLTTVSLKIIQGSPASP